MARRKRGSLPSSLLLLLVLSASLVRRRGEVLRQAESFVQPWPSWWRGRTGSRTAFQAAVDTPTSPASFEVEDLVEMLQRPGAMDDLRELMRRRLEDPVKREAFNARMSRVQAARDDSGAIDSQDPLLTLLQDPQAMNRIRDDPQRLLDLMAGLRGSVLFEEMRQMGSEVLEQIRIAKMPTGTLVEITGLTGAPELNGLIGKLVEPTYEETESMPERKVVEVQEDGARLALRPENLVFPRYRPGEAVMLNVEFDPNSEHAGLEGRAAVVQAITDEERDAGISDKSGMVIVDVLPLVPGGPVIHRIRMWPEHLQRRAFLSGDDVEISGLTKDERLNGLQGTVADPSPEELPAVQSGLVVVLLQDGQRLAVPQRNLLLTGAFLPALQGLR